MTRGIQLRISCLLALSLIFVTPALAQPPGPAGPTGSTGGDPGQRTPRRPGMNMPPRDSSLPAGEGAGRIRGRVTDDAGQGIRRATVTTFGAGQGRRQPSVAITDADGRFELSGLVAGTYQVSAAKGAFVRQSYGQRTIQGPGKPIELADGQAIDKIDIVLRRGGVIVGRVFDELGEPMAEMNVVPLRLVTVGGRKRLMPMGNRSETDDLGQFRLYRLQPGEYYISATQRGENFGPMASSGDNSGYAPTFAPGTTSVAEATRLEVVAGQEVNADIQLTAARMLRVSGVVTSSSGKPVAGGFVRLLPKSDVMMDFGGMGMASPIRDGGVFAINQVPPGPYTVSVRTSGEGGFGPPRRSVDNDDVEFAAMPITVAGDDLVNLRVVTSRGLTLTGAVIAEGATLPTDTPVRMMVIPADTEFGMMGARPTEVQADGRFQITGVMGEGTVSVVSMPPGWMLKSVSYKGADVTDKPVEFAADGGPVRVVLTNRITTITGSVTAGNGVPLTDYEVLIFPEDQTRWANLGRATRVARPDQQGVFKVQSMPPGDYHVVAFESLDSESRTNPEFLEKARHVAQPLTLREGQTQSLSLKLAALPQ
jgi:protocatechuate 3,4-dioxygenase beta subunit